MKKIVDWNNKEYLENIVKESTTQIDVIKKLGLSHKSSGNYQTLLKYIEFHQIDISHFDGKKIAYYKMSSQNSKKALTNELFFVNNSHRTTKAAKNRIIKYELKEHKCEECGLPPVWNGKILVLQLDHINQIKTDNRLENLRFLCPNCHTQTETYGKSKQKSLHQEFNVEIFQKYRKLPEKEDFIKQIKTLGRKKTKKELNISHKIFMLICKHYNINLDKISNENIKKIIWPPKELVQQQILNEPLVQLCKQYDCTDNGIRCFINKHKLFSPNLICKGYWNKIQANKFPLITMSDLYIDENDAYQLNPEKISIYKK